MPVSAVYRKSEIQDMVFEYGMGRTFTPSAAEAEELLQEAYAEVGTFLAGMKTQLERISEYIEIYESIDKDALSRIIKEYAVQRCTSYHNTF